VVVGGRAKLIKRKGIGRRAQGYFGHLATPSLGHYASLSFVVRGIRSRLESRSHREWRTTNRLMTTEFLRCRLGREYLVYNVKYLLTTSLIYFSQSLYL